MTVLSAQSIRGRCMSLVADQTRLSMLDPFHERTVSDGMTYGLSSAGYDVRIAENITLAPGAFALASTVERFNMPADLLAMVADKSTWARRGVCVQHTVIEPGWCGHLTLELTNHGRHPANIKAGMPIAQIIFHLLDAPTEQPYAGKYQDQQAGPQPARIERVPIRDRFSMQPGDDGRTDIYEGNTRVAYLDGFDLFGIGKDGYAHWICAVTDKSEIPLKLSGWSELGV